MNQTPNSIAIDWICDSVHLLVAVTPNTDKTNSMLDCSHGSVLINNRYGSLGTQKTKSSCVDTTLMTYKHRTKAQLQKDGILLPNRHKWTALPEPEPALSLTSLCGKGNNKFRAGLDESLCQPPWFEGHVERVARLGALHNNFAWTPVESIEASATQVAVGAKWCMAGSVQSKTVIKTLFYTAPCQGVSENSRKK